VSLFTNVPLDLAIESIEKRWEYIKSKDLLLSKNNVIYKIFCNNCEASYVGQTKRQLKTRLKEHKNNIKHDRSKHSVIFEHIVECNHSFDWEGIKIMARETNFYKRIVSEIIYIKEPKFGLNLNSTILSCLMNLTFIAK